MIWRNFWYWREGERNQTLEVGRNQEKSFSQNLYKKKSNKQHCVIFKKIIQWKFQCGRSLKKKRDREEDIWCHDLGSLSPLLLLLVCQSMMTRRRRRRRRRERGRGRRRRRGRKKNRDRFEKKNSDLWSTSSPFLPSFPWANYAPLSLWRGGGG